ncbi:MAG: hypothetical protein COA84_01075 [Robiginitomaculum sp.]|nr:MAG: hypothetical protein COA84_01075 [Robiginitomaculum sp.]
MLVLVFFSIFNIATLMPVSLGADAQKLAKSCIAEGETPALCKCYAGFVADNTTDKELSALTILTDPKHRGSLESALKALTAKGLTPGEIFKMAMKADALQGDAKARCEPESEE